MRTHQHWVYIVANKGNTVVYIGSTNDIVRRLFEHRTSESASAFAWRYQCWKLVHMEEFNDIGAAIRREKQLKNWKREWKNALIEKVDPHWSELSADWDYTGWFDPKNPPVGYYQQHLKEMWGGHSRDSGSSPE